MKTHTAEYAVTATIAGTETFCGQGRSLGQAITKANAIPGGKVYSLPQSVLDIQGGHVTVQVLRDMAKLEPIWEAQQ